MNVEIVREKKKRKIEYPCLMEHKGSRLIVLFNAKRIGTVIDNAGDYSIGYHSDTWTMEGFSEFEGKIILTNSETFSED